MIDTNEVTGYEHNDTEYAAALWDYVRAWLTVEEARDLVNGELGRIQQQGIDALEQWSLRNGFLDGQHRPPTASQRGYRNVLFNRLDEMPERLALQHWESELEFHRGTMVITDDRIFSIITVLEVGEDLFDVDLTDDIVERLHGLDECETKLDMLEARGAIDGIEWYDRTQQLEAEAEA